MTILVVGARGHVGRGVTRGLLGRGERVRASSRRPDAAAAPAGVEPVRGDLDDPATFPALLDGVRKAFVYAHADQAEAFAAAARKAGVEHIVLLSSNSVLFPDRSSNPVAMEHLAVEQALRASGVDWTFVRPGYLATNTYRWRRPISEERTVRGAFPDGSTPLVHEQDVADVAVQALLDDRHRGHAYLVLGGAALTERQQVAAIGDALGEPVRYETVSVDEYRAELSTRIPSFYVDAIIAVRGEVPQVPAELRVDAVPAVLGRPPRTFAAWARDHAEDFR